MTGIEVLGVERRRRWPDAVKLSILAEVDTNGWTLSDVAQRHDVTRQHLYQWRRELRAKGLWPEQASQEFVAVELLPACRDGEPFDIRESASPQITVVLRNGRELRCRETIEDTALSRLLRLLEAS
ncbi:IS66-like element accessory protein TnpA [Sphingobium xenophagum]|uniref:Transposase n=1 Tax=Sphingobium xenophagum TaxID=121428 RepID=A0A401J6E5_SPHXE|nr:transposase [Sphingobium xenophagum]GBH32221.1 transposase [Sphingobium xenophagum]